VRPSDSKRERRCVRRPRRSEVPMISVVFVSSSAHPIPFAVYAARIPEPHRHDQGPRESDAVTQDPRQTLSHVYPRPLTSLSPPPTSLVCHSRNHIHIPDFRPSSHPLPTLPSAQHPQQRSMRISPPVSFDIVFRLFLYSLCCPRCVFLLVLAPLFIPPQLRHTR
jgi:hypothetical protein